MNAHRAAAMHRLPYSDENQISNSRQDKLVSGVDDSTTSSTVVSTTRHLHDVDFSGGCPVASGAIGWKHPERCPQPLSAWHPDARFDSPREERERGLGSNSRGRVPSLIHLDFLPICLFQDRGRNSVCHLLSYLVISSHIPCLTPL